MTYLTPYDYAKMASLGGLGVSKISRAYSAYMNRNAYRGHGQMTKVNRKRKARNGGRSSSFAARVRSLEPYKHNTINDSTINNTLVHNSIFTTNLTSKITQGTANTDRIGDAVYLVSLKLKGLVNTPTTAGAYCYRVIIGWSGEEYNVSASTSGLTTAEIFLPTQGGNFPGGSNINPKAFTCLYDEFIDINSIVTAVADLQTMSIKVPLNQKFVYQASGSIYGKLKNLYLVVIAHVVGGTTGTTACGSMVLNADVVFQDA